MSGEGSTITSREFNHDTGRAKNAARSGPVHATDRGEPSFVLLSYDHYRDVRDAFANRILSIDQMVETVAASLHVPDPAPNNDAYISATALAHKLTMATRNVGDFTRFSGLEVVNPWDA